VIDKRTLRGAVVGDRAGDHLVLHGLADELEVVLGQLPRGLDRPRRPPLVKKHPVEVAGRVVATRSASSIAFGCA
jgi:hypothetical protein